MATQTFTMPAPLDVTLTPGNRTIRWGQTRAWDGNLDGLQLDADFVVGGGNAFLKVVWLSQGLANFFQVTDTNDDTTNPNDAGPELTEAFEGYEAALTFSASHGTLVIPGPTHASNSEVDTGTEPYTWKSSAAKRGEMSVWIAGLNQADTVTLTISDGTTTPPTPSDAAPVFATTTHVVVWQQDQEIDPVQVPLATGEPTPTYSAADTLPAGIAFDADTRLLTGTPTAGGFGIITIEATNSEGSAEWSLTYTIDPDIDSHLNPITGTGQLPYAGIIRLMPPRALGAGSPQGQTRRITEVTVGLYRSSGGLVRQAGQQRQGDPAPIVTPGPDDPVGPTGYPVFTGEVKIPLHDLATDPTAALQIEQREPLDLEITYLGMDIDSED